MTFLLYIRASLEKQDDPKNNPYTATSIEQYLFLVYIKSIKKKYLIHFTPVNVFYGGVKKIPACTRSLLLKKSFPPLEQGIKSLFWHKICIISYGFLKKGDQRN
jgi:hypothetical protein